MRECRDGAIELAGIAYPDGEHLRPERAGRALHRAALTRPGRYPRSLKERHSLHARSNLFEQLQPFRASKPCRGAAMPNGRCKVHGGKSTGPRTPEGLERSRRANWKHGHFSREAKAERSRVRAAILALRYLRIMEAPPN